MPKLNVKKSHSMARFCQALKTRRHFLLSCHVLPEGDAIGSMLAMDHLLRKLGKKTTIVCQDAFPARLSVLHNRRWQQLHELRKAPSSFDAVVTTDCPTLERIGNVQDLILPDTAVFNIDHHISNEYFGTYNYVKPEAAACGEVVFEIFKKMRVPITREVAKNLYVAIATDTGSFKYGNTTVRCHKIASELIALGIDSEKINDALYSTYSLSKIQLYSQLLARFKTAAKGQIAWTGVRQSDLTRAGATDEDLEGFIDFLKYLREVKVCFFLMETQDHETVRVSFRSKGRYDVNKLATYFHGGGHRKAAGCQIRGTLVQAEKMILRVLRREIVL